MKKQIQNLTIKGLQALAKNLKIPKYSTYGSKNRGELEALLLKHKDIKKVDFSKYDSYDVKEEPKSEAPVEDKGNSTEQAAEPSTDDKANDSESKEEENKDEAEKESEAKPVKKRPTSRRRSRNVRRR